MKLNDVSVTNSRVYLLINGKAFVYGKAYAKEFGECSIKNIICEYGKVFIELNGSDNNG